MLLDVVVLVVIIVLESKVSFDADELEDDESDCDQGRSDDCPRSRTFEEEIVGVIVVVVSLAASSFAAAKAEAAIYSMCFCSCAAAFAAALSRGPASLSCLSLNRI